MPATFCPPAFDGAAVGSGVTSGVASGVGEGVGAELGAGTGAGVGAAVMTLRDVGRGVGLKHPDSDRESCRAPLYWVLVA